MPRRKQALAEPSAVLAAVRAEDPEALREALGAGGSPSEGGDGFALGVACRAAGDVATTLIGLLLDAGADATQRDSNGFTAMHCAAENANAEAVDALAAAGAALDAADVAGWTALTLACRHAVSREEERAALRLIALGADPCLCDGEGRTPLMHAMSAGSAAVVKALLHAGADPSARDDRGCNAIHHCLLQSRGGPGNSRSAAVARALRVFADFQLAREQLRVVDQTGMGGMRPLACAALMANADACAVLLDAGEDPDEPIRAPESHYDGRTARELARGDAAELFRSRDDVRALRLELGMAVA